MGREGPLGNTLLELSNVFTLHSLSFGEGACSLGALAVTVLPRANSATLMQKCKHPRQRVINKMQKSNNLPQIATTKASPAEPESVWGKCSSEVL